MEKTKLLNVILGLMLLVSGLQAFQLNNLNLGINRMPSIQTAGSEIATGGGLSNLPQGNAQADAEYEKMMDEMHPGWRQQQGAPAAAQAPATGAAAPASSASGNALAQIGGLPNMVGGC
ncbi:hypothetical protein HY989_05405 [Candidatus Micrarchaeota archaeon]|nr:hypothetical protein [Candidatus Micrarchaeota archaeon]